MKNKTIILIPIFISLVTLCYNIKYGKIKDYLFENYIVEMEYNDTFTYHVNDEKEDDTDVDIEELEDEYV